MMAIRRGSPGTGDGQRRLDWSASRMEGVVATETAGYIDLSTKLSLLLSLSLRLSVPLSR